MKYIIYLSLLFSLLQSSCIKEEEQNAEADIINIILSDSIGVVKEVITNNRVTIFINPLLIDPANFTMNFNLVEGASITPLPNEVYDYSKEQIFTVTSEDKLWRKEYTVQVIAADIPTRYKFENWVEQDNFLNPIELIAIDGDHLPMHIWASANESFSFVAGGGGQEEYPTQRSEDAKEGTFSAKIITKITGDYYKPLAAGNLFIGEFDASQLDPKMSTKFGLPFNQKPLRLKGWYRYESGGVVAGTDKEDQCNIYALLFKTDEKTKVLNGHNVKNHPNIVARAQIQNTHSTHPQGEYIEFDLPFVYSEGIDSEKLSKYEYSLTIVFTSSDQGANYVGTPGSTLFLDNVELVCE